MNQTLAAPADSHFPQLQVLADPRAMKEHLQRQLPGFAAGHLHIHDLRLLQMRYKPGKKCEVCYELHISDLQSGRSGAQIFSGVIEAKGKLAARLAKAQNQSQVQPQFGPALHLLPELDLLLWGFPNDSRLRHLHRLLDSDRRRDLLRSHEELLRPAPGATLVTAEAEVVKYAPWDRCTLRHALRFSEGSTTVLYSKTYNHKTEAAAIFATLQAVWQSPLCQSGAFIVPRPLFFDAEMNTLFMSGLRGRNVDDHFAELDLAYTAARLGAGLAGLQQCQIGNLPRHTDQHVLAEVAKAEKIIADFDGAFQPAVAALGQALRTQHADLPALPITPIHNGFRISQCLLVDDTLAVIDFDDFQCGNPIGDVASFAAHLLYLPLREKLTPQQSAAALTHFCRGYAQAAPWGLPKAVLAWHTAAQLVAKQATKCITLAKKNHAEKVSRLLDLAAAILAHEKELY